MEINGANVFTTEELESLFGSEFEQTSPTAEGTEAQEGGNMATEETGNTQSSVETTKAFANRLKESTEKARKEEREAIAKSFGFDSFEAMQKSRERQVLEDKGLDPDIVNPVIDELVQQRLDNDPRMKELDGYRSRQVQEFGRRELAEITTLTGGKITSLAQLPREVIDLWAKKGSLKSAYLELEGEKLITSMRSEQSKGTTGHLATPSGSTKPDNGKRYLTAEEKRIWKMFNPKMTEEELNNKTVNT